MMSCSLPIAHEEIERRGMGKPDLLVLSKAMRSSLSPRGWLTLEPSTA